MGVFKEDLHFLTDLQKKQEQIWNDAADIGVKVENIHMDRMREVIKTLLKLPGSKLVWKQKANGWNQREYSLIIMWGADDDNLYSATEFHVGWYKDKRVEFFSIDSRAVLTTSEGKIVRESEGYRVKG